MNYHDWAKNASPYANAMSPQITCSTCMQCKKDFQRDDRMFFNPLLCYSCIGKDQMRGQYADLSHYNAAEKEDSGQFLDSPYGALLGALARSRSRLG